MSIPVLPYIPSMGVQHRLLRTVQKNLFGDGFYIQNDETETAFSRANGTKGVEYYKGLNNFVIGYNSAKKGAGLLADNLWNFFVARLDNLNEPFFFYNPTECDPPDLTGQETRGRYYVRLRDPNQVLSREYFRNCLYSYKLEFIECREFEAVSYEMIEIPIEILDIPISPYGAGSGYLQKKTKFQFNTNDYDELVDIKVEAVATNSSASDVTVTVSGGTVGSGVLTIPAGSNARLLRTGSGTGANGTDLIPTTGPCAYTVGIDTTNINQIEIHNLRLIVRQRTNLTKTRIQYPLIQSGVGSVGWSGVLPLVNAVDQFSHDSGVYGWSQWRQPSPGLYSYFKWIPARFDADTIQFELETNIGAFNTGQCAGALFRTDISGDMAVDVPANMVANSVAAGTFPSGWIVGDDYTQNLMSGEFPTTDLTENTVYEYRWRTSREAIIWFGSKLYKAHLYLCLTGARAFETYWRVSMPTAANSALHRMRLPSTSAYHESCGNFAPANSASLSDDGSINSGSQSGVVLSGSTVSYAVAAKVTRRSSLLSVTEGNHVSSLNNGATITNQLVVVPYDLT